MRLKDGRDSGFTLLELLVVVIILGVLVAIAVPRFNKAAERSRGTEAVVLLNSVKAAEESYYQEYDQYTDVTHLNTIAGFDGFPLNTNTSYYFNYALVFTATTFTATATRKTSVAQSRPPVWRGTAYTITLKQDGTLTNNMP